MQCSLHKNDMYVLPRHTPFYTNKVFAFMCYEVKICILHVHSKIYSEEQERSKGPSLFTRGRSKIERNKMVWFLSPQFEIQITYLGSPSVAPSLRGHIDVYPCWCQELQ